ncbi:MAG: glycosyltransferase [Cyanothece sp. SIO1E1]|nr:glycosyltransferase [Cyanothece sp. SIO1E1]
MIYFITVNYYSTELVRKLLTSVTTNAQFEYKPGSKPEYKLLIINNSPADRAINDLPSEFPHTTVVNAGNNLGFGAGCNLGMQQVYRQDPQALIWLINPDATLEPHAITYICQCFSQTPSLAILGTQIRDQTGDIWFRVGTFNRWTGSLKHQATGITSHPTQSQTALAGTVGQGKAPFQ